VKVLDVSDPSAVYQVASYDTPGFSLSLAVSDSEVLVADYFSLIGLRLPVSTGIDDPGTGDSRLPDRFQLKQNYPNPFNPSTTIEYHLPHATHSNLVVYNVLGQRVRTLVESYQSAGHYAVDWDGRDRNGHTVAGGVYLCRLSIDDSSLCRKLLLVK
jgi:hypothetical protein